MIYDLTSLLTSIASCSGTFIAIVGGFIARKFISMSQERHALEEEIAENREKIKNNEDRIQVLTQRFRLDEDPKIIFDEEADSATIRHKMRRQKWEERNRLFSENELLEFQFHQITLRRKNLENPHGMKKSLFVFVVFSIFGVLIPMILTPFKTESYALFLTTKIIVLSLFTGCLAYAYYYFLYLLRWKHEDVVKRWWEYFQPKKD